MAVYQIPPLCIQDDLLRLPPVMPTWLSTILKFLPVLSFHSLKCDHLFKNNPV